MEPTVNPDVKHLGTITYSLEQVPRTQMDKISILWEIATFIRTKSHVYIPYKKLPQVKVRMLQ